MASTIGFKQLRIRILDGTKATKNENLFVIDGTKDNGATASAKISGLAVESVKSWGSNKPYFVSGKGVGDVKIDFDIIDFPEKVQNAVLGLTEDENGLITATSDTEAPDVSVLIEDEDIRGNVVMLGFTTGKFSYDGAEFNTATDKASELAAETISFAGGANDKNEYYKRYIGKEEEKINAMLNALSMDVDSTAPIEPTGITLNQTTLSLEVGRTDTLSAIVTPDNADDKSVQFTSSDTAIVTITPVQGKVSGVAAGTATITGTTSNGLTATCQVTVTDPS